MPQPVRQVRRASGRVCWQVYPWQIGDMRLQHALSTWLPASLATVICCGQRDSSKTWDLQTRLMLSAACCTQAVAATKQSHHCISGTSTQRWPSSEHNLGSPVDRLMHQPKPASTSLVTHSRTAVPTALPQEQRTAAAQRRVWSAHRGRSADCHCSCIAAEAAVPGERPAGGQLAMPAVRQRRPHGVAAQRACRGCQGRPGTLPYHQWHVSRPCVTLHDRESAHA